jgi:uncharacterized protein (DUF433 family)
MVALKGTLQDRAEERVCLRSGRVWRAGESAGLHDDSVEYRMGMSKGQRGAYPADRAAALSGVPLSTVHEWSRKGVLVPSVSAERVKLWSFGDLMALRIIYWLRHPKAGSDGAPVPPTSMSEVKIALKQLAELDLDLWSETNGPTVSVDRAGNVSLRDGSDREVVNRQRRLAVAEEFDVTAPFQSYEGGRGPDLHAPRPTLRIVPGKLGGSPHVFHTRLESQAIAALDMRGLPTAKIYRLYPEVSPEAIDEAIDLETQLRRNLQPIAA